MGRECLESSLARGDAQTAAWSRACLIEALARLGREREAEVERGAAQGGLSRLGDGERFWLASSSALSCLLARDPEGAEEQADAALAIAERSAPVGYFIGAPLGSLAEVYVRLWTEAARDGRADAASFGDRAGRAIGLLEAYVKQCPFAEPFALVWRGSWHHQRGASARGQAAWAKAMAEAERLDMRQILGAACFEAGSRAQGEERKALLTRAAATWELAGAQRDRARALGATADG
jgi:hypothetical protein